MFLYCIISKNSYKNYRDIIKNITTIHISIIGKVGRGLLSAECKLYVIATMTTLQKIK